ncbi:MAG: hypothetical protein ABI718_11135 [Acidobacteriota bacterium]
MVVFGMFAMMSVSETLGRLRAPVEPMFGYAIRNLFTGGISLSILTERH